MLAVEAVVLTGGKSRRMGFDKSAILLPNGLTIAENTVREIETLGIAVTVIGRSVGSHVAVPDSGEGPAKAISCFSPTYDSVFVCSCDIPLFRASVIRPMFDAIDGHDAVVPVVDGQPQYLCAVYRARVFQQAVRSMRELTEMIDTRLVDCESLGIDPGWITGVNTPEELDSLLQSH